MNIITSDIFEYLPHYCQHCGKQINLSRKQIHNYELRGYPTFIHGHFPRNMKKKYLYGDFEFIPIYCSCPCRAEIPLSKKQIYEYEKYGYPKYIKGHFPKTEEYITKLKERRAKQIPPMLGKKNPSLSEYMKFYNPMFCPEVIEKFKGENSWMTTTEGRNWASERIKGDKNPTKNTKVKEKMSKKMKEYWKFHPEKKREIYLI